MACPACWISMGEGVTPPLLLLARSCRSSTLWLHRRVKRGRLQTCSVAAQWSLSDWTLLQLQSRQGQLLICTMQHTCLAMLLRHCNNNSSNSLALGAMCSETTQLGPTSRTQQQMCSEAPLLHLFRNIAQATCPTPCHRCEAEKALSLIPCTHNMTCHASSESIVTGPAAGVLTKSSQLFQTCLNAFYAYDSWFVQNPACMF